MIIIEVLKITEEKTITAGKELLNDVAPDQNFRLSSGGEIKNLRGLYAALQSMDDSTFGSHVTPEKNDFGNWIKDVHRDYRLANTLFSSKNKEDCVKAVGERIYEVEKISSPPCKEVPSTLRPKKAIAPTPAKVPVPQKESKELVRFRQEELIAKAVLSNKPTSAIIQAEKKARSRSKPAPEKPKDKNHPETASERLEKILAQAAKAKMEESSRIDNAVPKKLEEKALEEKPEGTSAQELVTEAASASSGVDEGSYEELLEIAENKSLSSQLKKEMKSMFSIRPMKSLKKETKNSFSKKKREDVDVSVTAAAKSPPIPEKAMMTKEMIIDHLKRVHK